MATEEPTVGDEAEQSLVVAPEHFASGIVEGTPDVFSTSALGTLVEKAAADWLHGFVDDSEMSVGAQITINHTAATPAGQRVTVTVRLEEAERLATTSPGPRRTRPRRSVPARTSVSSSTASDSSAG